MEKNLKMFRYIYISITSLYAFKLTQICKSNIFQFLKLLKKELIFILLVENSHLAKSLFIINGLEETYVLSSPQVQ